MFLLIFIYFNNAFYVICVENYSCEVYVVYVKEAKIQ